MISVKEITWQGGKVMTDKYIVSNICTDTLIFTYQNHNSVWAQQSAFSNNQDAICVNG